MPTNFHPTSLISVPVLHQNRRHYGDKDEENCHGDFNVTYSYFSSQPHIILAERRLSLASWSSDGWSPSFSPQQCWKHHVTLRSEPNPVQVCFGAVARARHPNKARATDIYEADRVRMMYGAADIWWELNSYLWKFLVEGKLWKAGLFSYLRGWRSAVRPRTNKN